jgi:starvation-inducible outer membrane lipoprotein
MSGMRRFFLVLLSSLLAVSCAVISKEAREDAEKDVSFRQLVENPSQHKGKIVILGGYILNARSAEGGVLIEVEQAPLSIWQIPKDRDQSEGRFVVVEKRSEDTASFKAGSAITVAGRVLGQMIPGTENCPGPCLKLESRELNVRWDPEVGGRGFVDFGNEFSSPWYFGGEFR